MGKRKRKRDENAVSRDFCFTLNNFTPDDESEIKAMFDNGICRYIIYGYEHLTTEEGKTPHLQGYCELTTGNTARPTGMHQYVKRAHFGSRCGTRTQARVYCLKDCQDPVEYGTWKPDYQGTRNDLLAVKNRIQEGKSEQFIANNHFDSWCKYRRAFNRYRDIIQVPAERIVEEYQRTWKTKVIVYWSEHTETGKTRKVYDEYGYAINSMTFRNGFWSPYNNEAIVLWDDFDPTCIERQQFLQLTDRYPCQIRQIGGWAQWKPKTLIITSNIDPHDWYGNDAAVLRRLDKVEEVPRAQRTITRNFVTVTTFAKSSEDKTLEFQY